MSIPKFDIKADLQLKDALMVMGKHRAFDIEADRPFLFMITEGGTDVILFIGSVQAF
ncbi:serpin family protein [uncultured Bacteroides sp.]|uniref:serpin family protein n=2 Tax=uncultured Bacteroides sp. TaxID=162156 RepID=UPI0026313335|nr:serpin family protein [uncultured Bacteroides sp.]